MALCESVGDAAAMVEPVARRAQSRYAASQDNAAPGTRKAQLWGASANKNSYIRNLLLVLL